MKTYMIIIVFGILFSFNTFGQSTKIEFKYQHGAKIIAPTIQNLAKLPEIKPENFGIALTSSYKKLGNEAGYTLYQNGDCYSRDGNGRITVHKSQYTMEVTIEWQPNSHEAQKGISDEIFTDLKIALRPYYKKNAEGMVIFEVPVDGKKFSFMLHETPYLTTLFISRIE